MKKLVFLAAIGIIFAISGSATAQSTWQSQLKSMPALAIAGLGITPAQEKALDGIHTQICSEAKQVCNSAVPDSEKQAKMGALAGKFLTSSMAVLTPKQIDTALTMGAAWLGAHPAITIKRTEAIWFLKECKLTDSQMALIDKAFSDHVAKAAAANKDDSLTAEQKDAQLWKLRKESLDRIHAGLQLDQQEAMSSLLKSAIGNYNAVKDKLTSDQKPKFDALIQAIFAFAEAKVTLN